MTKISTRIEFPGAGLHWIIEIETHADELYMVCIEQHEHQVDGGSIRTVCTEQLASKDDLQRLRDSITRFIGD